MTTNWAENLIRSRYISIAAVSGLMCFVNNKTAKYLQNHK